MKSWSLRSRLLTVIGILSLISIGMFTAMTFKCFEGVKAGKQLAVKTAAEDLLDKLDRNLFERYGDVQAFSLSEPAKSGDKARIIAFMADMVPAYAPIYQLMMVVNAKGKLIAVNNADKDGKPIDTSALYNNDYANEIWLQKSLKGEIKPGTSFVEDLHVDKDVASVYHTKGNVMNFSAPILSAQGKVLGVWTNRVSWTDVIEQITKEQMDAIKSVSMPVVLAYLMNPSGLFLEHPQGDEFVLKKTQDGFQERFASLSSGTYIKSGNLESPAYSGPIYEATAKSKGYSTYPGIGWVATVQVPQADPLKTSTMIFAGIASIVILLSVVFGYSVIRGLIAQFNSIVVTLTTDAEELGATATMLNDSSQKLANGATEQASSLQETASSVEEISSMVNKSADGASRALKVATTSQETATKGKSTVDQMIRAIGEINDSNSVVMDQFAQNNVQLSNIIKVISEIGTKTKVINDIVFQTKLLSFNASVEAARAGEHGKGFAVVAEEVGNLAQMSGNAAKEIGDMLNESISTVQKIVDETKGKVEQLISESKSKIEEGTSVAKDCGVTLEEIVKNESEVNLMMNEISTASQEQATGVSEINKAIASLDKVTHQNTNVAQETAEQAERVTTQASHLKSQVSNLKDIIWGQNRKRSTPANPPSHSEGHNRPAKAYSSSSNTKDKNVIQFPKASPQVAGNYQRAGVPLKTAIGAEEALPSEHDARFEEV